MAPITGTVRAHGEPMAEVIVSDGHDVTRTGPDGTFTLPGDGPFVFITRPRGWDAERWYLPIDGHEPLRFELHQVADPQPLRFTQMTDLHLSVGGEMLTDPNEDALFRFVDGQLVRRDVAPIEAGRPLVAAMYAESPDLVIATGDVTNRSRDEEFEAYRGLVDAMPCPVFTVPGNHDVMPQPGDEPMVGSTQQVDRDVYGVVTHRYEAHLGPRWYSFDRGGLHVVVLDWYTMYLGLDAEQQRAWLEADLATVASDQPYLLLTHDQLAADWVASLPRPPVAVVSGHRHTSRVVRADGIWWISTGTALFGGLDHTEPHIRTLTWDGAELQVGRSPTSPRGAVGHDDDGETWHVELPGTGNRAAPVAAGGTVFVVTEDETRATGTLSALDVATGDLRWQLTLPEPSKCDPLVVGDQVVVTLVTGRTLAFDLTSGVQRWENVPGPATDLWVYAPPVTDGQRIYVVEPTWVGAFAVDTGRLAWERTDLGRRSPMSTLARPAVLDDALLLGLFAHLPGLWALDGATGLTRWPDDHQGRLAFEGRADLVDGLPRSLCSSLTVDPGTGDVYGRRLGEQLFRVDASDGAARWEAPVDGWFDVAAPVLAGDGVITVSQGRDLVCIHRTDGRRRWSTRLDVADAPVQRPYARRPTSLTAAPVLAGQVLVVARGDGSLVSVDVADGRVRSTGSPAAPTAAGPLLVEDQVVTIDLGGVARARPLRSVVSDEGAVR